MSKLNTQNYFSTGLVSTMDTSIVGEIEIQLAVAPNSDLGYLIIDYTDDILREEIFYHRKAGTSVFTYGVNRTNPQAHDIAASVQMNDSASIFNYILDLLPDHFFMYKTSATTCYVKGGKIFDDGEYFTIADEANLSLSVGTNYVYVVDATINATLSTITDRLVVGEIIVDGAGNITELNNYNTMSAITERTNLILRGAGAPDSGLGINGDYYIDDTNARLYGPKFGGVNWGSYVTIKGNDGIQGIQGPVGPAGSITEAAPEEESDIDTNVTTSAIISTDGTTHITLTNADTSYIKYGLTEILSVDKNGNTTRNKSITGSFTVPDTSGITYSDGLRIDKVSGTSSFIGVPIYRDFDNIITGYNNFEGDVTFSGQVGMIYNVNVAEDFSFDANEGLKQGFNSAIGGAITMNFSNLVRGTTITFAITAVGTPITLSLGTLNSKDLPIEGFNPFMLGATSIPELEVGTHIFVAEIFSTGFHLAYTGKSTGL